MYRADKLVGNFGEVLKEQCGYLADPTLPLWQNVEMRIGEMGRDRQACLATTCCNTM